MPRAKTKRRDGSAPVFRVTRVYLKDCLWDTLPERLRRKALQQERVYGAQAMQEVAPGQGNGAAGAPQAACLSLEEQRPQVAPSSGEGSGAQACAAAAGGQAQEGPGASPYSREATGCPIPAPRDNLAAVGGQGGGIDPFEEDLLPAPAPSAEALTLSGAMQAAAPGSYGACAPESLQPESWVVLEEGGWQAVWEGSQGAVYFGNAALGLTQWEVPPCLAHWDWAAWGEAYRRQLLLQHHPQQRHLQEQVQVSRQHVHADQGAAEQWQQAPCSVPELSQDPLCTSLHQGALYPGPPDHAPGGFPAHGAAGAPPGVPIVYHEQLERELLQVQETQSSLEGRGPAASARAAPGREQNAERAGGPDRRGGQDAGRGGSPGGQDLVLPVAPEQDPAACLSAPWASRSNGKVLQGDVSADDPPGVRRRSHQNVPLALKQPQQHVVPRVLTQNKGVLEPAWPPCSSHEEEGLHSAGSQAEASQDKPSTPFLAEASQDKPSTPFQAGASQDKPSTPFLAGASQDKPSTPFLAPHCAGCVQRVGAMSLLVTALHWSLEVACSWSTRLVLWLQALWRPRAPHRTVQGRGRTPPTVSLPPALPVAHQGERELRPAASPPPASASAGGGLGRHPGAAESESSLRPPQDSGEPAHGSPGLGQGCASVGPDTAGELARRAAEGMPAGVPKEHDRYWAQRYSLFALFDRGVRMAEDSWYSVTPQVLAQHHARRCAGGVAVDAFCGVGGNAIQLALRCRHVIAIDVEPAKLHMASWNLGLYQGEALPRTPCGSVDFLIGDCLQLLPSIQADVVFLSPPWGGPTYRSAKEYDTSTMLLPVSGYQILQLALACAPRAALFLPRNTPLDHLKHLWFSVAPHLPCEVETAYLNGKVKAITMYIGDFNGYQCKHIA